MHYIISAAHTTRLVGDVLAYGVVFTTEKDRSMRVTLP
jgi:hypothetical protein